MDGILPRLKHSHGALQETSEERDALTVSLEKRRTVKRKVAKHIDMGNFGYIDSFWDKTKNRNVTLVKAKYGGHDYLGAQEGVQDAMSHMFKL